MVHRERQGVMPPILVVGGSALDSREHGSAMRDGRAQCPNSVNGERSVAGVDGFSAVEPESAEQGHDPLFASQRLTGVRFARSTFE